MFPERLGAFEITAVLGEGGSAVVYATKSGDRDVALKVLHPDLYLDEAQVVRFLEEADRMRRVRHPALVELCGAGTLPGGRPFILMPLLRGRSLAARLQDGPLPLGTALEMFDGLASAVAALHNAGLVHRDIKPENVFWRDPEPSSRTSGPTLVLLDLGIARESQAGPSTTTKAGLMRGTPAYMAPERLFGQPASIRTDIYELGLLLFMMLTASLPWDEGDPGGRLSPRLRDEDRSRVPEGLASLLFEVLSVDVSKRPESVEELASRVRIARPRVESLAPASAPPLAAQASMPMATNPTPLASAIPYTPTPSPAAKRSTTMTVVTFALGAALAVGATLAIPRISELTQAKSAAAVDDDATDERVAEASASAVPTPSVSVLPVESAEPVVSASASAWVSASASGKAPIKEGTLPAGVIEARVRARMGAMQACMQTMGDQPGFTGGRVATNFWIGLEGNVTSAGGTSSDLPNNVVQCVLTQLRVVRFPKPVGGPVNVIMPLRFVVTKKAEDAGATGSAAPPAIP
jgi:serine/threonine protein kinase